VSDFSREKTRFRERCDVSCTLWSSHKYFDKLQMWYAQETRDRAPKRKAARATCERYGGAKEGKMTEAANEALTGREA